MTSRRPTHAGSWYEASGPKLDAQLNSWLHAVPSNPAGPTQTKALIGPHAGFSYSGPSAAWAYETIVDPSQFNRIFILGPSHKYFLDGCALTRCADYATPLGSLPIDQETTQKLRDTGSFSDMSLAQDEDEHSIELHLPYIRKVFAQKDVQIVPILVGSISTSKEADFGVLLAPFLNDPKTFTVVSSDFCHWGSRFDYTFYIPGSSIALPYNISRSKPPLVDVSIHDSIEALDKEGMSILERGGIDGHSSWSEYLKRTKNTVCGRHPIGVLLAAMAQIAPTSSEITFTHYAQSSKCLTPTDSSVSYASAGVRW